MRVPRSSVERAGAAGATTGADVRLGSGHAAAPTPAVSLVRLAWNQLGRISVQTVEKLQKKELPQFISMHSHLGEPL